MMDDFKQALSNVISSCGALSEAWEKLDDEGMESILKKYPFDKDFREVIQTLVEWKETLE